MKLRTREYYRWDKVALEDVGVPIETIIARCKYLGQLRHLVEEATEETAEEANKKVMEKYPDG